MFKKIIYCIIVCYNGESFLPELFNTLQQTIIPKNAELKIVVVNNASTDHSLNYLKTIENIHLIENSNNTGFAEGNNIGLRYALNQGADFVFLLNQDTTVDKNWLIEILATAERHPKAGAIQSLLLLYPKSKENNLQINSWGNELQFLGFGYSGGLLTNFEPSKLSEKSITYASGAAVLFRIEALKQVGLFDESYFLYHEDTDLSLRLRITTWDIVLSPKSIIYHKFKFTQSPNTYYHLEKNRFRILLEYYKFPTLLLLLPFFIFFEAGLTFFAWRRGFLKQRVNAWVWIFKNLPVVMKKRKSIQILRQISDRKFTTWLRADIDFQGVNNPLLQFVANPLGQIYWNLIRHLLFW